MEICQIITPAELAGSSHSGENLQQYMRSFRKDENEVKREETIMVRALYKATNMYKAEKDKLEKSEKEVIGLKKKFRSWKSVKELQV
jgi:hypothetical protein